MQKTQSKPIDPRRKPAPADSADDEPKRPENRSDFESERDFHNSNKRSNPSPESGSEGDHR